MKGKWVTMLWYDDSCYPTNLDNRWTSHLIIFLSSRHDDVGRNITPSVHPIKKPAYEGTYRMGGPMQNIWVLRDIIHRVYPLRKCDSSNAVVERRWHLSERDVDVVLFVGAWRHVGRQLRGDSLFRAQWWNHIACWKAAARRHTSRKAGMTVKRQYFKKYRNFRMALIPSYLSLSSSLNPN